MAAIADLFARHAPNGVGGLEELDEEARRQYLLHQAKILEAAQRRGLSIQEVGRLWGAAETPVSPSALLTPGPASSIEESVPAPNPQPLTLASLKVPGGLLAAGVLRQGLTDAFALWCVAYTLDIDNDRVVANARQAPAQGWVTVEAAKAVLQPLVGHDRFYRLLRAAAKAGFVIRAHRRDGTPVIYYRARLKLGLDLSLDTLGEPVRIPLAWVAAANDWKAGLFAAVHVGRARQAAPISRETLQALTGLPARTQRLYEQQVGITAQTNLCLSRLEADHHDLMTALDVRPGCFTYFDKKTKTAFVAWHLPNSYTPPATCQRARSGMNRQHNRFLRRSNRLINGGWQCNGREGDVPRFPRIFWADVPAAEATRDKVQCDKPGVPSAFMATLPNPERFAPSKWRTGALRLTRAGHGLWVLIPGQAEAALDPTVLARQLTGLGQPPTPGIVAKNVLH